MTLTDAVEQLAAELARQADAAFDYSTRMAEKGHDQAARRAAVKASVLFRRSNDLLDQVERQRTVDTETTLGA